MNTKTSQPAYRRQPEQRDGEQALFRRLSSQQVRDLLIGHAPRRFDQPKLGKKRAQSTPADTALGPRIPDVTENTS
ncbi:hypothetical protein MTO96_002590 [Rhipicephalus appendiculatus]